MSAANAAEVLVGGTDPAGGIGDFYLTNGVVTAIVDGVGVQQDLFDETGIRVPRQNSVAPTGGTLVDLARVGLGNDQLTQAFLVVGIDSDQLPSYESVETAVEPSAAVVRAIGSVPFDPDTDDGPLPERALTVITEYRAEGVRPALTMRTTVANPGPDPVPLLNVFDAIPWTMKGPLPFTPMPGKGFHHHVLPDFTMPQALVPAFELAPYVVAAGVVDERDGPIDDRTGRPEAPVGGVCYGIVSGGATLDADGAGPLPASPAVGPPFVFGLNNTTASAVGFGGPNVIPPGGSFTYTRHLFVGARSDVAACTDLILDHFGVPTVEARGRVADTSGAGVDASLLISLSGPPPLPELLPGAPLTQVRTAADGSFRLRLPAGIYRVRASASERPAVEGVLTVASDGVASLALAAMEEPARIAVAVEVDGAAAPARVSFLPDGGEPPRIGKLFDVVTFDTSRPGACAADSGRSCTSDAECEAAGPCVRVCSLDPERRCASDLECLP
ncbi:MAG: carboxypeptidase-like regulatory domain-containing protein, partial [Candidatus Binatia bacterium]